MPKLIKRKIDWAPHKNLFIELVPHAKSTEPKNEGESDISCEFSYSTVKGHKAWGKALKRVYLMDAGMSVESDWAVSYSRDCLHLTPSFSSVGRGQSESGDIEMLKLFSLCRLCNARHQSVTVKVKATNRNFPSPSRNDCVHRLHVIELKPFLFLLQPRAKNFFQPIITTNGTNYTSTANYEFLFIGSFMLSGLSCSLK